jgi:hypothetical protein
MASATMWWKNKCMKKEKENKKVVTIEEKKETKDEKQLN